MPWKAKLALLAVFPIFSACFFDDPAKKNPNSSIKNPTSCVTPLSAPTAGATGVGLVFDPDPMSASGLGTLPPTSSSIENYKKEVDLAYLGGYGVLEGQYVDVRNRLQCNDGFGVLDSKNNFKFNQSQSGFQEVMSYYHGTNFRKMLDDSGYLKPATLKIVAHCMKEDNAYYVKGYAGSTLIEEVCLGDSVTTPQASYADDAQVTIHEIQHASTSNFYSQENYLNQFFYDEAGALNEAISDFMAMVATDAAVHPDLDHKVFSRWALGTFVPSSAGGRGTHHCPSYDPTYPLCDKYEAGFGGFSAQDNRVSYSYPDGIGWPHDTHYSGPGYLRNIYLNFPYQEEIHNAAVAFSGVLWDAFFRVKDNYDKDSPAPAQVMTKAIHEALMVMPQPSLAAKISPVTFRDLSQAIVDAAGVVAKAEDQKVINDAFIQRGFLDDKVTGSWASVGPGSAATPGLKVLDDPFTLKKWFGSFLSSVVTQASSNLRLSPGDAAALWFDIQNNDKRSVGGVTLTVKINSPHVEFLSENYNVGFASKTSSQIQYYKINGLGVVESLSSAQAAYHVPTANSYFKTNPYFASFLTTTVFVKVKSSAPVGAKVTFGVLVEPSNGDAEILNFETTIQ